MLYETVMGWMAAQRNEGIAIGEKQGSYQKALETARRALERGFAPDVIADLTWLPVDEVRALLVGRTATKWGRRSPPLPALVHCGKAHCGLALHQLHQPLGRHRVGYFHEACDVSTRHVVACGGVLLGSFPSVVVDGLHDTLELVVDLAECPRKPL